MDDETNMSQNNSSSRENEHDDIEQSDVQEKVFQEEETLPCGIDSKQCTMCVLIKNGSPKVPDKTSAIEEAETCYPEPGRAECAEIDRNCEDCTTTINTQKNYDDQQLPTHSDKNTGEKEAQDGTTLHCYPVSGQQLCTQEVKKCNVCPLGPQIHYDQKPVDDKIPAPPVDTTNPDSHLVLNTTSTISEQQDENVTKKPICNACTQMQAWEGKQIHSEQSEKTYEKSRISVSESEVQSPANNFDICRPEPDKKQCEEQANICEDCANVTSRAEDEEGEQNISQNILLSTKENEEITTVDISHEPAVFLSDLSAQQQAEGSSVLCAPNVDGKECHDGSRLCGECTDSTPSENQQPTQKISTQDASEELAVKTSEVDTHQSAEMISVLCPHKGDKTVCLEDTRLCVACTETTISQDEHTTEKDTPVDASKGLAVTPSELERQRAEASDHQVITRQSILCHPADHDGMCHDASKLCVVCTESKTAKDEYPTQKTSTQDVSEEPEVKTLELDALHPTEMISVLCARKGEETVCIEDSRLCIVCTETTIVQEEQATERLPTEEISEETAVTPSELDTQKRDEETSFLCAPKDDEVLCHYDSRLCVVCTESTTAEDKQPSQEIYTRDVSEEAEVTISELDAQQPGQMISVLCARKGDETVCLEDSRLCVVCTESTIARVHQSTEQPEPLDGSRDAVVTSKVGEQEHPDHTSVLCTREPGKETCNIEANICGECTKNLRQDGLQINVRSDPPKSETSSSNPTELGHDEISQSGSKTTFDTVTPQNIQSSPNDDSDTCHPSPGDPQCDASKGECEKCSSFKKPNNGSSMGSLRGGADFPDAFMDVSNVELGSCIYKHINKKTYFIPLRGGADTPEPSIDDCNDIESPSLCFCNSNAMAYTNVTNPPPPPQFLDEEHSNLQYEPVKFESVTVSRGKEGKITTVASVRENQLKNMTDVEKEKLVLRDVIFEIRKISAALDNLSSQLAIETVISLRPNEEIFYAIRHGNGKILLINVSESGQVNINCSDDTAVRNTMSQKEVRTLNDLPSFSNNSENTHERDMNYHPFQIEKVTINNAIHMDEINTQVDHCESTDDYTQGKGHNEREVKIIAERVINNITTLAQILCNLFIQKGGVRALDITPNTILCPADEGECISFECLNAKCGFTAAKHNSKEEDKCDCDDINSKKWTAQGEEKFNIEKEVRVVAEKVVNNVTNLAELIYSAVLRKGGIAIRSEVSKEMMKVETWSENHDHERTNLVVTNDSVEGDVRQTAQKLIDDVIKLSQLMYAVVHRYGEFTARTILNQELPAENMFSDEEIIQVPKKNGKCKCDSLLAIKRDSKNIDNNYDLESLHSYDDVEREVKAKAEEFVNNISTLAEILYRVLCKKEQYFPRRIESKEMSQQNIQQTDKYYAGDDKNEKIACVRTAAENLVNNVTALAQLIFGVVYRHGQTFAKVINAQTPMLIDQAHECPTECNLMKSNATPIDEGRITQVPIENKICECNSLSIETAVACNERMKKPYEGNEICCVGIHDNDERNVTAEAKKLVNNVTTLSQKLYRVLYEKGTSVIRSDSNETMAKRGGEKWTEIHVSGKENTSDHDRSVHDIQIVAKKLIDNVMTLAQMIYGIIYEKRMHYTIQNSAPEKIPEDFRFTQLPDIIASNGENNQNMAVSAYVPDKLFQKGSRKCECRHLKLKTKQ